MQKQKQLNKYSTGIEALGDENLEGKVAIVTGGNRGIGYETVRVLAIGGAKVYMACRSIKSGEDAKASMVKKGDIKGSIVVSSLDLRDFDSIHSFTKLFLAKEKQLNYLILNAGAESKVKRYTKHNFEQNFGVNHMGAFVMTQDLLPLMTRQEFHSRIVVVCSAIYTVIRLFDINDLNYRKGLYIPLWAYGRSKLCNSYFAIELSKRLKDTNVLVFQVNPGQFANQKSMRKVWTDPL